MSTEPYLTLTAALPGGELTVLVDPDDGSVVASGFGGLEPTLALLADDERARGHAPARATDPVAAPVAVALRAYAEGELDALAVVPVRQPGGPFQQRAWAALRGVQAGETDSYAGLAARAGSPDAVRAAGQACARNKVAPFVPCHRILRSDGSLGGYAYGLAVKRALLEHEGVQLGGRAAEVAVLF